MQSVIVYRNPLEAMMWDSLMNGGFFFYFLIIAFLAVMIPVLINWMVSGCYYRNSQKNVFRKIGYWINCKMDKVTIGVVLVVFTVGFYFAA